jgi:hypothetical protein
VTRFLRCGSAGRSPAAPILSSASRETAAGPGSVLAEVSGAVKLNNGLHGNAIPYRYLLPRFPEDPYDIGGIPVDGARFTRSNEELAGMAAALRAAL